MKEGLYLVLSNLKTVVIHGDICYFLADVSKAIQYKSYVPKKLLKGIPKSEIRETCRPDYYKKSVNRKFICVTEKGAKQIIANKEGNTSKNTKLSLFEKIDLARKYGVSEGFITAHLYAGDLEKQLEYRRKYFGIEDEVKSYNCRDFTKKTMW